MGFGSGGIGLGGCQGRCERRSEIFCENSYFLGGDGLVGSHVGVGVGLVGGVGGRGGCERNVGDRG